MVTERSQPNGVELKMRERKLRVGVNWQGGLREKKAQNKRTYNKGFTLII